MTIFQMQNKILALGWQFQEHVYNDGLEDNCSIEFTQDKSPHALSKYPRPDDCVGWGRFVRQYAWEMAYDSLVAKKEFPKT